MLQDYEIIGTNKSKTSKWLPYIEFVLILIILHSALALFMGEGEEEASIRFRLLAHSNTEADQAVKSEIQREIEPLIQEAVSTSKTVDELGRNLEALEGKIKEIAHSIAKDVPVTLERTDALFPAKRAGFVIHPQAKYDAYILTIGSGRGDNWWCSLFPKVCFQDKQEESEEKVTFFIWEWLKGLFS